MYLAGGRWSKAPCCAKPHFIAVKMSSCGSCGLQPSDRSKGLIHTNINQLESVYLWTRWPKEWSPLSIKCRNFLLCMFWFHCSWKRKVWWHTIRLEVAQFIGPHTLTSEVSRGQAVATATSNASCQTERDAPLWQSLGAQAARLFNCRVTGKGNFACRPE